MQTRPQPAYDADPSPAATIPATAAGPEPLLVLRQAGEAALRTPLPAGSQVVLGRTRSCDLRVLHPSVSRTHARIWNDDGEVWIEDLGTVHGTGLDGRRIEAPVRLGDGVEIELGRCLGDGWSLRFEDPALALVREMGLLESAEEEWPEEEDDADAMDLEATHGSTASETRAESPGGPREDEDGDGEAFEATLAAKGDAEDSARPAVSRRALSLVRRPLLWLAVAACLGTGGLVAWAAQVMQPSAVGWRWVHMTPPEIAGGVVLGLDSPDIHPAADLEVRLGGVEVTPRTVRGRMEIEVPALDGPALDPTGGFAVAGRHDVELVVRVAEGREIFRATLPYVVIPQIESLRPPAVEEGEVVEVTGHHLAAGVEGLEAPPPLVRVGEVDAEVLDAGPTRLRLRVPDLGRDRTVHQPVEVTVGSWTARSPVTLEVRVPPRAPDPPFFRLERGSGTWWLHPAVGPPLAYASQRAGERAVEAWNEVLDRATEDPTITLGVAAEGRVYVLRAAGSSFASPRVLGRFGVRELRAATAEKGVEPGLLAHWLATAWNPLVDALARGVVPQIDPSSGLSPGYGAALAALVRERDRVALREERPHRHLGGRLAPVEEGELARVLRAFPRHLAEVAGGWSARLENVFLPGEGYRCLVDLDLHRFDETLGGTARLRFVKEEAGIEFSLPETRLTGELRPGPVPRLVLHARFGRPVGKLELHADFAGGGLDGVYSGSRVEGREARWRAERRVEAVTDW